MSKFIGVSRRTLLALLIVASLRPCMGFAEFSCSQEVTYKWSRGEGESKIESTIHWGTYKSSGADEASVKEQLEPFVTRERKRASEACRDLHENLSGCIATKYAVHQAEFRGMEFSSRKVLQQAIEQDCKEQQGKCLEIAAGEQKCSEIKKADDAAAEGDAKKDDKGKKKK